MTTPASANRDGEARIKRWREAQRGLEIAKSRQREAECELQNAEQHLAKWLAPPDLAVGETVGVWCRVGEHEELVQVTRVRVPTIGAEDGSEVDASELQISVRGKR